MKVIILCSFLLLAGAVSCSPAESTAVTAWAADARLDIPEWILDLISLLPDSIQEIIDKLPEIIAAIPGILERLKEIVALIIEKIPEILPVILEQLPAIIEQIPAIISHIRDIIVQIIDKIPELIPIILEQIPIILDKIPEILEAIRGIYERIREILENLDLPDWFPTLPDLEKPEWWPDEIPTLPDIQPFVPGTAVSIEEYPGIVQIEVGTGPVWVQGCVGSVLTSFHVLSTARCFSGRLYRPHFRRVRAGSSERYSGGSITDVQSAVVHPDWSGGVESDIAVVRLANNLVLGSTIAQTPIVSQDFITPNGIGVKLASWGSTAQGKRIADRGLYEIDLAVIDRENCNNRWGRIPRLTVGENSLCVGRIETGGRNSDIRDMGAPVYYGGVLVGIVSLGAPVGNQHLPPVVTNVASYTNWVVYQANN